ncbi:hypothetical protein FRC02_000887 [Tulasnella sp. 418]|nr:hypothetical protein FRC02_000887 [Tulasnella sp. 418]
MTDVTSSLPDHEEKSRHSHQTSARSSTVSSRADSPIPDALQQNSTGNQSAIDNTNDMPIDPVATPAVTSEPGEVENGMLLDDAPSKAPTGSSTGPRREGSRVLLRFDSSRSNHVIDSFFVDNKNGVSFRIKCVAQSQELLGAFWAVINGSNSYLLQGVGADGEQDSSSIDVSSAVALGRNVIYWFGLRHNLARTSVFTLEMVST